MAITQTTVGTSATAIYTSSGTSATTVIYFMNGHSASVTLQIHVVPSGGTASATNLIVKDLVVAASDTYVMDVEKLILENGDTVQASSDVAAVVQATVSYIGI